MTNRFCVNCVHVVHKHFWDLSLFEKFPKCDLFIRKETFDPVTGKRHLNSDYSSSCELNRSENGGCGGRLFVEKKTISISKIFKWLKEKI